MSRRNSKDVLNFIKRRKADLASIFGGKCCLCGFNTFQEALEFHHVDPKNKEFQLFSKGHMTKSLEKQIREIKKCILVCANCHRGIHAGHLSVPDNWESYFNQDVADQLQKNLYNKRHKLTIQKTCPCCGKSFTVPKKMKDQKFCSTECVKFFFTSRSST